jgi:peptidoglycan/xylan/chitin deacetylase (PgdA/CDA1 family)
MKKFLFSIFLFFFAYVLVAPAIEAGEIAITIDDAPRGSKELFTGEERTKKLIESLKKAKVPDVLFFIKTSNINEKSKKRLESYINAGFHIANHSHGHYWTNRVSIDQYLEDITKAHGILSKFDNFVPLYRYPFLDEGKDRQIRDKIKEHLAKLGYKNGYVTVDNYDWHMDTLLQQALKAGKKINFEKLKKVYVESLWESITFYDNIAKQVLGRSPKHVLLLHENDLAALFIADLVVHIRAKGWKIISPLEAYTDPISKVIPDVLFNNQGRVAAIARKKGYEKRQLVHESEDTKYLEELFKKRGVFE